MNKGWAQQLRTMAGDFRSGKAGAMSRLAVSLASATILLAMIMSIMGLLAVAGGIRVREVHVALFLALGAATWFFVLTQIWRGYTRGRRVLPTILGLLAIWATAIPTAVLIGETFRSEGGFLIAAVMLTAVTASILLILLTAYQQVRGVSICRDDGMVNVFCPGCGYSMIGLRESRCPECGGAYTIDELIREQRYEARTGDQRVAAGNGKRLQITQ
ncbi:MAG: RING finger protein [Planctomycetota bacterium]